MDSDILIWHLRGAPRALDFLRTLQRQVDLELWTGAMQRAEVVFFMRPEEEKATELFLSQFRTASVDQKTVDRAGALYRRWNPTHGIDVNDALLSASVMETGGKLYTLNDRHFTMLDIPVSRPW